MLNIFGGLDLRKGLYPSAALKTLDSCVSQESDYNFVAASADEYDESEGLSFPRFMIAGACAGIAEHSCMFPIDTVKTVMQAEGAFTGGGAVYSSMVSTVRNLIASDGPMRLWRGMGSMVMASGPAHACYFSVYEGVKEVLGGNQGGHQPIAAGTAGSVATLVHDALMSPADVVKQRMQLAARPFPNMRSCLMTVVREEGFGALYAGYSTTVAMNIPFAAVHFVCYESAKEVLKGDEEGEGSVGVHFAAGALAGASAAFVTNPMDVVRTRLQTQGEVGMQYTGMKDAIRTIRRNEGRRGFWRGVRPRVLFHMPAAAICWVTYEFVKGVIRDSNFGGNTDDNSTSSWMTQTATNLSVTKCDYQSVSSKPQ